MSCLEIKDAFQNVPESPFLTTDPEHERTEGKKETFYTR